MSRRPAPFLRSEARNDSGDWVQAVSFLFSAGSEAHELLRIWVHQGLHVRGNVRKFPK